MIAAVFGFVSRQNRPKVVVTSKMGRNLCDSFGSSSLIANLPWHGFGKIRGDERDIDDGKYGMDEGPTRTFDKHVAWRYDDMRGSKYLPTVASLLADKVIREDEIVGFSDENREHILRSASIR